MEDNKKKVDIKDLKDEIAGLGISEDDINAMSVTGLSDRPSEHSSQYGQKGLTPAEIKAKIAELPEYIAGQFNGLLETLTALISAIEGRDVKSISFNADGGITITRNDDTVTETESFLITDVSKGGNAPPTAEAVKKYTDDTANAVKERADNAVNNDIKPKAIGVPEFNEETGVITFKTLDGDEKKTKEINLLLESEFDGGYYDSDTNELVIKFKNSENKVCLPASALLCPTWVSDIDKMSDEQKATPPTAEAVKEYVDNLFSDQLAKMKIYGVDNVGQSSPTLTRTDAAVGLGYTIGTSEIESDFDRCFPWCDMKEVTDGFGNVFIRVPKFYTKITKNSNGTYKHQISGCRYDGFSTLFVDGKGNELDYILIGKYEGSYDSTNARMMSKSGQTVKVSITLPNYRKACMAVGEGYQQYDFLIDAIIKELFMIEFATTNCQSIMQGFTRGDIAAALITGHTDNVKTASGSYNNNHDLEVDPWVDTSCNTDALHACKYRGIENPWGNVSKWCDGINFKKEKIYICESPTEYESDKYDAPYTYVGDRPREGYVKTVTPFAKNPLLGYVSEIGANYITHYSDYSGYADGGTVLNCGGHWDNGEYAGLWRWYGGNSSSYAYGLVGGRLCYKPL